MFTSSGISGLDSILNGGFRTARTTVVVGGPGSGKTAMGIQFLTHGAAFSSEPGILISFEDAPDALESDFSDLEIPFAASIGKGIQLIDGRPPLDTTISGAYNLDGLIAILEALTEENDARRIVIDGLDALFAVKSDVWQIRREVLRLLSWVRDSKLTAIVTLKAGQSAAEIPEQFGFAEFAADAVIHLQSSMLQQFQQRTLRVLKTRGAPFVEGNHAYSIRKSGIRVLFTPQRTAPSESFAGAPRCSTGIERLDTMLEGGLNRGTTMLISGLPGSAKTTLAASFLHAGCAAGEPGLYIGFDEPAEQMLSDMASVGTELRPYRENGLLHVESFSAGAVIADEHYLAIEALVEEFKPRRVVIDPLSALEKAGGTHVADAVGEALVGMLKARGISTIFTAVSDAGTPLVESTPLRISTVADTWIHLSFASESGERNRTLTIVKSRGTAHSGQMREVALSAAGVTLKDVYSVGGSVLFGAARFEREQAALAEAERVALEAGSLLSALDDEELELLARSEVTKSRLAKIEMRRNVINSRHEAELRRWSENAQALRKLRREDETTGNGVAHD